ncbi:MAG: hypothetical protein GEU88_16795, partial [Solirubrobacterales bacterium]|nr:hypothetical protein [Solirubrobacterales bacterium]
VQRIDDTFYYYYSTSAFGTNNSAIGLKTTQTPSDPSSYADIGHPVVAEVAERTGRTPAQVLLRWSVQRGIPVIPKSVRRERIVENARIFDFSLGEHDMSLLDGLDRTGGTGRARERKWWTPSGRARARVRRAAGRFRG